MMNDVLTKVILKNLDAIIEFSMILVTTLAGSYSKDYLRMMKCTCPCGVDVKRATLSTITATIVVLCLAPYITSYLGQRLLILVSFIAGLVGFQLLEKLSTDVCVS